MGHACIAIAIGARLLHAGTFPARASFRAASASAIRQGQKTFRSFSSARVLLNVEFTVSLISRGVRLPAVHALNIKGRVQRKRR